MRGMALTTGHHWPIAARRLTRMPIRNSAKALSGWACRRPLMMIMKQSLPIQGPSSPGGFSHRARGCRMLSSAMVFGKSRSAGMKRFTILLLAPVLAFSLAASAQERAKPEEISPGTAVENVIVTAPALRTEKALDNFIIAHAAPTQWLGKIARWKTG